MESSTAVAALAALAQETRLAAFRHLVQAGPAGVCAGDLAGAVKVPRATLSFHLKELSHAGLVQARQEGRFIFYSADFPAMNALLAYLTENCCAAEPCGLPAPCPAPVPKPGRTKARRRA